MGSAPAPCGWSALARAFFFSFSLIATYVYRLEPSSTSAMPICRAREGGS